MQVAGKSSANGFLYELPSITDRLDLSKLFPKAQPLEVELGSGDAGFLIEWAKRHPTHNFIGVERLLGRIRKLDRKGQRAGLTNLRGVRIECSYFLEYLLPKDSLTALHVYFPDPWPKQKHRKNRLVNEHFADVAHRALRADGIIHFRTDDEDYFEQMRRVFSAHSGFRVTETPRELLEVLTDFEREFLARGVNTRSVSYRRI